MVKLFKIIVSLNIQQPNPPNNYIKKKVTTMHDYMVKMELITHHKGYRTPTL